jgi:hypothetical protein
MCLAGAADCWSRGGAAAFIEIEELFAEAVWCGATSPTCLQVQRSQCHGLDLFFRPKSLPNFYHRVLPLVHVLKPLSGLSSCKTLQELTFQNSLLGLCGSGPVVAILAPPTVLKASGGGALFKEFSSGGERGGREAGQEESERGGGGSEGGGEVSKSGAGGSEMGEGSRRRRTMLTKIDNTEVVCICACKLNAETMCIII